MDLIKERNGFVYGYVLRGGAQQGTTATLVFGCSAQPWPRRLLELRLGVRIRMRLSPLTLTASQPRRARARERGGECIRFLTLIV